MLSRVCSGNWQEGSVNARASDGDGEGDEPIFIDRDSYRFRFVLDYMRDSKIELPLSIPRGQFIRDLIYYGLDYVDEDITLSVANPSDLFHSLGRFRDYFQAQEADVNERLRVILTEKLACKGRQWVFFEVDHRTLHV